MRPISFEIDLWRGREQPETRTYSDGKPFPCAAFRRALVFYFCELDMGLAVCHCYQNRSDGTWHYSHTDEYGVSLHILPYYKGRWLWRWGTTHVYYDGPHCAWSFGLFTIRWDNWNCKHCCPDE